MNVAQMIQDLEAERDSICDVIDALQKLKDRGSAPVNVPATTSKARPRSVDSSAGAPAKPYSKSNPRRPKAFKCPDCPKAYTSKSALGYHQRENHANGKTPPAAPLVQCLDCRVPNWFKDREELNAHRIAVHGPINRAARA